MTDDARDRAQKALRTPDLEWAGPMVHGLANDVLALADRVDELERELQRGPDLREAFVRGILEAVDRAHGPDLELGVWVVDVFCRLPSRFTDPDAAVAVGFVPVEHPRLGRVYVVPRAHALVSAPPGTVTWPTEPVDG